MEQPFFGLIVRRRRVHWPHSTCIDWGRGHRVVAALLSTAIAIATLPSVSVANNGSVAMAAPVETIVVDGDLSDWPAAVERVPIGLNLYGDVSDSETDHIASYRVGYSGALGHLFLAIEVVDDSGVYPADPAEPTAWNTHDGVAFGIALNHEKKGCIGLDFGIRSSTSPSLISVDGMLVSTATNKQAVVAAYRTDENKRVYEWRVDLRGVGYTGSLTRPFTCGWTVNINDADADGTFSTLYWSPGTHKMKSADRLGDLIVGCQRDEVGILAGQVIVDGRHPALSPIPIRLQSVDHPQLVVDIVSDTAGRFRQTLPAGRYRRSIRHRTATIASADYVLIAPQQVTNDQFRLPKIAVQPSELGEGRTTAIGTGVRSDSMTVFSSADKIAYGRIHAITHDRVGQLWLGTDLGLVRIASGEITTFDTADGLPHEEVRTLLYDAKKDELWIGTADGLACLVETSKAPRLIPTNPLTFREIKSVVFDHRGRICVCTTDGLFFLRSIVDSPAKATPSAEFRTAEINAVAADRQRGCTWLGTERGVAAMRNGVIAPMSKAIRAAKLRVTSLFVAEHGILWIGSNTGLWSYEPAADRLTLVHPGRRHDSIRQILEYEDGQVLATSAKGLLRVPNADAEATRPSTVPLATMGNANLLGTEAAVIDPGTHQANCLAIDTDRSLWLGTSTGQLIRFDKHLTRLVGGDIQFVDTTACRDVWVVAWDKARGNSYLHRPLVKNSVRYDLPAEVEVACLSAVSNDEVWLGTSNGVWQLSGGTLERVLDPGWPRARVSRIFRQFKSTFWLATNDGLFRVSGRDIDRFTTIDGLPNNHVTDVCVDADQRIIVGTMHGIGVYDHQHWTQHDESNGLLSNMVYRVCVDRQGRIWVGSDRGVDQLQGLEKRSFTVRDRMPQNHVDQFLRVGHDNHLWIGTAAGTARSDGEVLQPMGSYTGLGRSLIRDIAGDETQTWLATNNGLWRYIQPISSPRLILDRTLTDRSLKASDEVVMTTDVPELEFQFRSISLNWRSDSMLYRYRLLGHSSEWQTGHLPRIKFNNLRRGDFQFQMVAIDGDLNRSGPLTVDVYVTAPNQRLLVSGLLIVGFSGCAVLGLLYVRKTKRVTSELEHRVEERTDEIRRVVRERIKLQAALQQSQKMKALGTLATGIAHDFNNSLSAIIANAELAKLENREDSVDELLEAILQVTEQATGLSRSLLTVGGKSRSEKRPTDLKQLIQFGMTVIRRTIPAVIEIDLALADNQLWSQVDATQIHQVLMNLAVNARDAMPNGGMLCVTLAEYKPVEPLLTAAVNGRQPPARSADVRPTPTGLRLDSLPVSPQPHISRKSSMAVIQFRDSGVGIPPDVRERIFEPFFTSKARGHGTGLGLSIVHAIVDDHGGSIEIESSAEAGTIVTIELPLCAPPEAKPEGEVRQDVPQTGVSRMAGSLALIADDQPSVRKGLASTLGYLGLDVVTTRNGRECLSRFRQMQSAVDVVILDVDMPTMNGIDCLLQIRLLNPKVPIILITGMADHDIGAHVDPITQVIRKPFSIEAVRTAIDASMAVRSC